MYHWKLAALHAHIRKQRRAFLSPSHKLLALINKAGCTVVTVPFPWNWTQRHDQHSSTTAAVVQEALKLCWKWVQSKALCWDLPVGEVPVQWVVLASKSALQKSDPSRLSKMQFWEIFPYTRQPMAYLFQQHRVSAAAFQGIKVAGAGSKEARMDSQWSQRHWTCGW